MALNSNNMPRFGVGFAAAAAAIAARNGGVAPKYTPRPAPAPAVALNVAAAPAAANRLGVGQRVRGTDVVPADYATVNRNFRGQIIEFGAWGVNDVRVKMEGTKKVFKVNSRYLLPV